MSPPISAAPSGDPLNANAFDLRAAYEGQSLTAFSGALDDLREAADRLRRDEQPNRLGQDLEISVIETARTVQQHLLGQLRHPEPTNQFKAIRNDGPQADQALQKLLSQAEKFAKRSQQLLVLPTAGQFADAGALDDLINAIDGLRQASPSLANAGARDELDQITGLLSDPDPEAMHRFATETEAALTKIGEQLTGPKAVSDDFAQHLFLDRQVRPKLEEALTALSETKPLAEIGQQAAMINSPTERLTFVKDALALMQRSEPEFDDVIPTEGGSLILPGTAGGDAASASGLIISDDITAQFDAVRTFEDRRQDPKIAQALVAFSKAHAGLNAQLSGLFPDGETADGQLALNSDDDGQPSIDLTDRAKLGRAIASRDKVDALIKAQPIQSPETLPVILATTPQAELDLIQDSLRNTLGDGYRGSKDWQDPTARLALDVEIAAAGMADQIADIEKLDAGADNMDRLEHAGLSEASLDQLHDKRAVEALIDRFPASAAKVEDALGMSLRRPDFKAMGVELPTAEVPAQTETPGLILPPGYRH